MKIASPLTSQINWLLLSEEEIRRAREFIATSGSDSTVDVLGLGAPAEKISDLFFPGSSTLHTELRYVIFVSAILYAIQEKGGVDDPSKFLKKKEAELIKCLVDGGEKQGVIGRNRGKDLQYWPSTTYWTAINEFQTLDVKYRDRALVLDRLSARASVGLVSDDGDSTDDREQAFSGNPAFKRIALCLFTDTDKKRARWREKLTFRLSVDEARFLRDQIRDLHSRSLYAELLKLPPAKLKGIESVFDLKRVRPELSQLIWQAGLYSRIAMGATLAYRWELCGHLASHCKGTKQEDDWLVSQAGNARLFAIWTKEAKTMHKWHVAEVEKAIRVADPGKKLTSGMFDDRLVEFCEHMNSILKQRSSIGAKLGEVGNLARKREMQIKKSRSHFRDPSIRVPENVKANPDSERQEYLFNYRWERGKLNTLSIQNGLTDR